MRYDGFIEYLLNKERLYFEKKDNYYIFSSPFSQDNNPSCVFYFDGYMAIHNGVLPKVNKVAKRRLFITEVAELLGYLPELVYWIGEKLHISQYQINKFIDLHNDLFQDEEYAKYRKKVYKITQNIYLSFDKISNMKKLEKKFDTTQVKARAKKKKSKVELESPNLAQRAAIDRYAKSRGLDMQSNHFDYGAVNVNDIFKTPAIIMRYDDEYTKARLISGGLRYLSFGTYSTPATIQNNNSNTLHIIEGYIDAVVFSKYTNKDVMALDSCTSYKFDDLSRYSNIIIWLDKDKYNIDKINKYKKILDCSVVYKSEDNRDFNDMECDNKNILKNIKKILDKLID